MVGKRNSNSNEYWIKVQISSFSGNLDIKSFLNWIYEVDNFFDIAYVLIEKQVKFVVYKGGVVEGSIANYKKTSWQATRDDVEAHEITASR